MPHTPKVSGPRTADISFHETPKNVKRPLSSVIMQIVIPVFGLLANLSSVAGGIVCLVAPLPIPGAVVIVAIIVGLGGISAFTIVLIRGNRTKIPKPAQTIAAPTKKTVFIKPSWAGTVLGSPVVTAKSEVDSTTTLVPATPQRTPNKYRTLRTPKTPEELKKREEQVAQCQALHQVLATPDVDPKIIDKAVEASKLLAANPDLVLEEESGRKLFEELEALASPPAAPTAPGEMTPPSEDLLILNALQNSADAIWIESLAGNVEKARKLIDENAEFAASEAGVSLKSKLDEIASFLPVQKEIIEHRNGLKVKIETPVADLRNMKKYLEEFRDIITKLVESQGKVETFGFIDKAQKELQSELNAALGKAKAYIGEVLVVKTTNINAILRMGANYKTVYPDFKGMFDAIDQGIRAPNSNSASKPKVASPARRGSKGITTADLDAAGVLSAEMAKRSKALGNNDKKKADGEESDEENIDDGSRVSTPRNSGVFKRKVAKRSSPTWTRADATKMKAAAASNAKAAEEAKASASKLAAGKPPKPQPSPNRRSLTGVLGGIGKRLQQVQANLETVKRHELALSEKQSKDAEWSDTD
jgi:hypothetical protein